MNTLQVTVIEHTFKFEKVVTNNKVNFQPPFAQFPYKRPNSSTSQSLSPLFLSLPMSVWIRGGGMKFRKRNLKN